MSRPVAVADRLRHRTYNVGSGRPTSHGDVVAALRVVVPESRFSLRDGRNPASPEDFYLDVTRPHEDTAFVPEFDVRRGVADYVEWLRAGDPR